MLPLFWSTGWRRTGAWNILAAFIAGIILLGCLGGSLAQSGSSLKDDAILFYGNCTTSRYLNVGLHLLINLLSTAVLASSNYFMQVLNAPSRDEINEAHLRLSSLEIGIPSLKNLPYLSAFKRSLWGLLLITSLPIHFVFNSSIYETTFEGSTWQLTLAAEGFLHGAPFFPPGARLAPAGSASPWVFNQSWEKEDNIRLRGYWSYYGDNIDVSDYWNESSHARQKLNQVSKDAAAGERDQQWVHLTPKDCQLEYSTCRPRNKYGDVVLIVGTGTHAAGWTRSEVYTDSQDKLPDWKKHIPRDEVNSLWYSSSCVAWRPIGTIGRSSECDIDTTYPCDGLLGAMGSELEEDYAENDPELEDWSIDTTNGSANGQLWDGAFGFNERFHHLNVKYCLADPAPANRCKVIVANNLILVTMICVFLKVLFCTVVVLGLPTESLVTPGDAINSFLCKPDPATRGLGAMDYRDAHSLGCSIPYPLLKADEEHSLLSTTQIARIWRYRKRRVINIIPRSAWWRAYGPILVSLSILAFFTATSVGPSDNGL